jgi:hypothetical protein
LEGTEDVTILEGAEEVIVSFAIVGEEKEKEESCGDKGSGLTEEEFESE